jgi:5-methylcytosine-specific restriction endonuclease McrA
MNKKLYNYIIQGDTDRFYWSPQWRNKRKYIVDRDNKECQRCKENGRVGKGETVHHVKHLTDRPDLALVDDNLITLCYSCHNELHPEKWGEGIKKDKFMNEERWE